MQGESDDDNGCSGSTDGLVRASPSDLHPLAFVHNAVHMHVR